MKVSELKGKAGCVLIGCGEATVFYPRAGQEGDPASECNSMSLEVEGEDVDEYEVKFQAAEHLDVDENEILVIYD